MKNGVTRTQYKVFVLAVKYLPICAGICQVINTLSSYFGYTIEPLSNIAGMSVFTWIYTYVCAVTFRFCSYHKAVLWYILADDALNIVDYYWDMPVSTDNILMIHNVLIGVLLLTLLYLHAKSHKKSAGENHQ